ncbi:MAG TPA: DUF5615 family PIN-like protein [Nitrospira sp.]|nr:DUF5615 family PIN-like protein [Nitrospira sp.]
MRIKLDENLPLRLVRILARFGHETDTVPQEGLASQDDVHVWRSAQAVGRFFITQDLDFSDVRRFAPGTHHPNASSIAFIQQDDPRYPVL